MTKEKDNEKPKSRNSNPDIHKLGQETQFGAEKGPDRKETQAKAKKTIRNRANMRLALRRIAASDIDPTKPLTVTGLANKIFPGKLTTAQLLAVRQIVMALDGNEKMLIRTSDELCGKLVERHIEAQTTLEDLVTRSYGSENNDEYSSESSEEDSILEE